MIEPPMPLAPEPWATAPAPEPALLRAQVATLQLENAALRAENAALQQRIRELEARLGQNSSNSSRPPSSDQPQAPRKRPVLSSGRKRGGQPGHRGACRALLPVEKVDEVVGVVPERCQHCQQPFPEPAGRRRARVWRYQVAELLPLAVRVTEYQMAVRRCPNCRRRTRTDLPAGAPRRPFGPRLTAAIALLSGRYRLSRREVRQMLQDLWAVKLSLGAVVHQEQVQSAALAPVVAEAQAAVQQAPVVNVNETGWRQAQQRAWLWTSVTGELAAALCRELRKWWPARWTFARVAGVEPTNNGAERALRPAVLWRKGCFGSDTAAGSQFAERLLTVVATCRQQGRLLLDFLVAAGEATLRGNRPPSLIPALQES